ncbi:hypothetical protein STEG23_020127 [Scotinomys teguina]
MVLWESPRQCSSWTLCEGFCWLLLLPVTLLIIARPVKLAAFPTSLSDCQTPTGWNCSGYDDRENDLFLCDTNTCKFDGECLRIGDTVTCVCQFKCNSDYVPVCGSNGESYQNECYLRQAACKQQSEILVVSEGSCATAAVHLTKQAALWTVLPYMSIPKRPRLDLWCAGSVVLQVGQVCCCSSCGCSSVVLQVGQVCCCSSCGCGSVVLQVGQTRVCLGERLGGNTVVVQVEKALVVVTREDVVTLVFSSPFRYLKSWGNKHLPNHLHERKGADKDTFVYREQEHNKERKECLESHICGASLEKGKNTTKKCKTVTV